jgi:HrpA-like RNA helicase
MYVFIFVPCMHADMKTDLSILVFLPGLGEIERMASYFIEETEGEWGWVDAKLAS